jgi:hypothetical protein
MADRRWTALAVATLSLAPLVAQSRWTYAAGDRFEVYTTGGSAVAQRAIEDFERVHVYLEQALRTPPITGPRTRLIVFSNRNEFSPYAANASVQAFYQSNVDGDFIVLPGLGRDAFRAVAHEYAHLIARRTGRRYPLWLDDGLADYFSTVMPLGAKVQIGAALPDRLKSLGFGVRLMPLERLFAITRDSAEYTTPARSALFYAESWAFTHMLLTDDRYRDRSAALLARLAHGEPAALALTNIYDKPVSAITTDLTKYALRGYYRTSTIDVALPANTSTVVPRPATEFEAGIRLADLLAANPSHLGRARTAFETLERENPNDLQLLESEAMFAVRTGRVDEARPYLEHAIALGSSNARIYSHLAEIRGTSADRQDFSASDEDALFAKALTLGPDDAEVRIQVARSLVRQHRGADALAMLDAITRVPIEYEQLFAETRAAALKIGGAPP